MKFDDEIEITRAAARALNVQDHATHVCLRKDGMLYFSTDAKEADRDGGYWREQGFLFKRIVEA